jgi:hypothetical protein
MKFIIANDMMINVNYIHQIYVDSIETNNGKEYRVMVCYKDHQGDARERRYFSSNNEKAAKTAYYELFNRLNGKEEE